MSRILNNLSHITISMRRGKQETDICETSHHSSSYGCDCIKRDPGGNYYFPASLLLSWEVVVYALLSLTVVRIVPIFLSLALFLRLSPSMRVYSRVDSWHLVVICSVFLSLIAHGISAHLLAKWIGRKENDI